MARESSDPWKRLRDREDEETTSLTLRERRAGVEKAPNVTKGAEFDTEKLENQLDATRTLIDQLNNLYNMYIAGVEQRPPLEKRKLLDKTMEQLLTVPKPTSASMFRFGSLQANYNTYRDRWDRMMRDLESGKIKRRV